MSRGPVPVKTPGGNQKTPGATQFLFLEHVLLGYILKIHFFGQTEAINIILKEKMHRFISPIHRDKAVLENKPL